MGKGLQLMQGLCITAVLSGCVTTSTNVFSEASDEVALRNYLQLSTGYLEQGDLVNTRRHLANALAIDPRNSEAHGIQALVHSRQGDTALADASFQRAIQLDRNNSQVRNNYAAFLYAEQRYQAAFEQLQQVVQDTEYRARPQAFENLGLAALRLERPAEAENAFSRALQLNPNQWRSSLELTDINLRNDNVLQARAFYRNFLTLSQFFNVGQSPRSLWIGIQLETALGNDANVHEYALVLEELYGDSEEFQLYLNSLNDE